MNHDSPRRRRGCEEGETLHGLLAPTEAEERAGDGPLRVEHEEISPEDAKRRHLRRRNTMLTAIVLFAVALIISGTIVGPRLGLFQTKDYHGEGNGTSVTFTVSDGDGNATIAQNLESEGVVADADRFLEVYEERSDGQFIQPGTFELQERMSSESATDSMLGTGGAAEHYVAINQGLRMDETFQQLAEATGIPVSAFEEFEDDPSAFGIPEEFPTIEGYLHPGEYRFPTDAGAEDVLKEMTQRTKDDLADLDITGDEEIFHAVTVGSILEFEATPQDYAAVAGAIDNRIENPDGETQGFLQSDATVAYGLGEKTYQISNEQKADTGNQYNTFAHQGLPAGPIGSPDKAALSAAADPEDNDYYFWVTVDLDTGETKFARTYEEHQQNVAEYDQWCSENEGKCV